MLEIERELNELDDIINEQNRQLAIEERETNDEKEQLVQLEENQASRLEEIGRLNERDIEMEQKLKETQNAVLTAKGDLKRIESLELDLVKGFTRFVFYFLHWSFIDILKRVFYIQITVRPTKRPFF